MRPYVIISATKGIGLRELKARVNLESKRILKERKALAVGSRQSAVGSLDKGKKYGVARKKVPQKEKTAIGKRDENWERVHVGVIGVPNSGKSSVINFITRKSAAKTGAKAGFTKGMQKIRMSEGILILDTPGVIPESRYTTEKKGFAEDVKIGARSYSDVRDPEAAVSYLLESKSQVAGRRSQVEGEMIARAISRFYGIVFEGADDLIEQIGKKKGFLGKGGVVDEDRAARLVLRDWQEGKIRV